MSFLRRTSLPRLILVCGVVVVAGASAAFATALGSGPKPAPQSLAGAVHDALSAPAVQGVSARIQFTNTLISSSSLQQGSTPLLSGSSGRLWASANGRVRLELQSNHGDIEIISDGQTITYLDGAHATAYRYALPTSHESAPTASSTTGHGLPTVEQIQSFLGRLAPHAAVSGAVPDDVAGRPAYHVTVWPRRDGGLLGGAELWWDAVHGVPLRLAVYAAGRTDPVLELGVTSIHFGSVDRSVFAVPAGAKVVSVRTPSGAATKAKAGRRAHARVATATGVAAVQAKLPFTLSAPATLHGIGRSQVRLLDWGGHPAALVTYGQGLGGLAVIERPADKTAAQPSGATPPAGHDASPTLPSVTINGAHGTELVTALGTVLEYQRGNVSYVVAGSVTGPDAEAAARGL